MAFNRKIELSIIGDAITQISDLHIEFNIEKSRKFAENIAEFIIYNAKQDTVKKILKKGNSVLFKFGYEDEDKGAISAVFSGNIVKSSSVLSGPDYITTITSAPSRDTTIVISYTTDTLLSSVLKQIGTALGLSIIGEENARIKLENGFTYVGSIRGALDYCRKILKANNAAVYIDTEIRVYKTGNRVSRFEPVFLDYTSGLLNIEDVTEEDNQNKADPKRYAFESIIIPKLQPGGLVTIKTDKVNGTFLVESLVLSGDNFGGENMCSGEIIE